MKYLIALDYPTREHYIHRLFWSLPHSFSIGWIQYADKAKTFEHDEAVSLVGILENNRTSTTQGSLTIVPCTTNHNAYDRAMGVII